MARVSRNFRNGKLPPLRDTYISCAFCFDTADERSGNKIGHRIFPGDDTPRTFIECNLVNCIPPPGSTLIDCNTAILERNLVSGRPNDPDTDDPDLDVVIHGRTNPETLDAEYLDTPKRVRQ